MDEARQILLSSLQTSGISLPSNVYSIKDLTPDTLLSICAQFFILIGDDDSSRQFPGSLPSVMADRFKVCEEMASAIKAKGYREQLSFHQFMYPSDEDSYNLVRFLVEKLSEGRKESDDSISAHLVCHEAKGDIPTGNEQDEAVEGHIEDSSNPEAVIHSEKENICWMERKSVVVSKQLSELRDEVNNLNNQEKALMEAKHSKALEIDKLECESEILKRALDMASDDQYSAEFSLNKLNEEVESRSNRIMELKMQWESLNQTNEDSKVLERLDSFKEIEQKTEATLSEIRRRELEYSKLLEEIPKLPKIPPRKFYIERITEITQNSWKQDADIDRILKETRALKLESNSIQERLDRTYVVVDEAVFREAKKDATGRLVYRLLTSIHDNFEQLSAKTLAIDRARREAAEQEAKLAALSSRNIDISKLQSDLDSIRKENELLEQKLNSSASSIINI